MAALHTRMPVILEEEDWRAWLGEVDRDPLALLRPASAGVLRVWPVSRAVNTVKNNGAALLEEHKEAVLL
jgi:putative SOS response-associated peptidase YedK